MKQAEEMIQAVKDWVKRRLEQTNTYMEENFLKMTGDASKVTNVFSAYSSRTLPKSGEELDITLGKILRYLKDLQYVAFNGSYRDLTGKPVQDAFKTEINAVSAAEEITLFYMEDFALSGGHLSWEFIGPPLLIYGSGGTATATATGTTDFMRCYLVFYRRRNSSTNAGEGWGLVQLGSVGQTARWSLTATVTTATSFKHGLVLKVPKGSWAKVNVMSLPD